MHSTHPTVLVCALLLAGCASSGNSPEPAPKPARLSDPVAEATRLKKAEASGELEPNALKHAAYLGDPPARSALGLSAEVEIKEVGKIAQLGGPSAFRTALAAQVYADPESDWAGVKASLARWIAEPSEASLRDATAAAVAKLREQLSAEVQRQSGVTEEVAEDGTPVVGVPDMSEESARELIRLTSQIEALRFLEQCAAQADNAERLANAFDRALRPGMGKAYEDVERDNPGPKPSEAVKEDLAGALAAHNRGPQTEEARAFVKARNAHQRSLRPLAKRRLLEALRDSLVPELLGR
jgi:hypothetical protein